MTLYQVLDAFVAENIDRNLPRDTFSEDIRECVAQNSQLFKTDRNLFDAIYGRDEFRGLNKWVLDWVTNQCRGNRITYHFTENPSCSWMQELTIMTLEGPNLGPIRHLLLSTENKTQLLSDLAFETEQVPFESLSAIINEDSNRAYIYLFLDTYLGLVKDALDEAHFTIPELKDYDDTTLRFRGAQWFEEAQKIDITLIGLGGIGSHTALLLSKFKPHQISLWDNDAVEAVNMAGQLYKVNQVGSRKVFCTRNNIAEFSNYYDVFSHASRFTIRHDPTPITICGLDNMGARKDCFKAWLRRVRQSSFPSEFLFIDGRLAAEELQVFCIRGDSNYDIERYEEKYLFPSSEAEQTTCSYKQTAYMANMIAGVICNLVANYLANKQIPDFRDLPFLTTYNGYTMSFKTIN